MKYPGNFCFHDSPINLRKNEVQMSYVFAYTFTKLKPRLQQQNIATDF